MNRRSAPPRPAAATARPAAAPRPVAAAATARPAAVARPVAARPAAPPSPPAPGRPIAPLEPDEFSATEVLLDGVRAWLSQLPAFAGVALLLHVPLLLVLLLPALPGPLVALIMVVAELGIALLVKTALVKAVLDGQRGLPSDFVELLQALRKAPVALVLGARILGRAFVKMFLLVPGIHYLCETFAAVPAVIAEEGSMSAALKRSEKLTAGAILHVFGICAVIWTLSIVLTLASGLHKSDSVTLGNATFLIVYLCARALDTSLAAVLSAMTYRHLGDRPHV
jgi:hypothetical protein